MLLSDYLDPTKKKENFSKAEVEVVDFKETIKIKEEELEEIEIEVEDQVLVAAASEGFRANKPTERFRETSRQRDLS
jgi:hypothetical protein